MQDRDNIAFTQSALNAMHEIDVAISNHLRWLRELHRSFICGDLPDPDNLAEDAHCRCKFGRWYYSHRDPSVAGDKDFIQLGIQHQAMHDQARKLLQLRAANGAIAPDEYDGFMDAAMVFKSAAHTFQWRLVNRICVVDQLTGAWNRYAMILRLSEERARVERTGQPCCLCLLDIDHFKQVNDLHGHLAGDLALQALVRFLSERVRKSDSVFRFGGEEFLICLPNTTLPEAAVLLERMREELAGLDIDIGNGRTIRLTASFGVAVLDPDEEFDSSVDHADHALLSAKAQGRNRVCAWDMSTDAGELNC
jgi:diguanylate cyclase (GGDEF)-like protein